MTDFYSIIQACFLIHQDNNTLKLKIFQKMSYNDINKYIDSNFTKSKIYDKLIQHLVFSFIVG